MSSAGPTLSSVAPGTQALHSVYTFGTNLLQVTEDVTYTDGTQSVGLRYAITNISTVPVSFSAGELADLYAAGSDNGTGIHQAGPPELIGGVSANGAVTGIEEGTPEWAHFQSGPFGDVFANFEAAVLNDQADPNNVDNGAGAQWDFNDVPAGQSRTIDVTWRVGDTSAPPPTPQPPPQPPPAPAPPPGPAPLPPPVAGKTVNATTKSGTVRIKLPGTDQFLVLGAGQQIPLGTTVDTTAGRVTLTAAADTHGTTQAADFYQGIFKVAQTKGAKPVTELALVEKLSCSAAKSSASAAAAKKKSRRLWGDGTGKFRTRGQFSSATVRGTVWLTQDRCDGTLTKVRRGVVTVRDFVKRRSVLVKAGRSYFARARRR